METLVYNHDKGEEDTAQIKNILRNKHLNIGKKILVVNLIFIITYLGYWTSLNLQIFYFHSNVRPLKVFKTLNFDFLQ